MTIQLTLNEADRAELRRWVRRGSTPHKQVQRARIILMSADGVASAEIVRRVGVSYPTLTRWRARYAEAGIEGLRQGKTRKPGTAPVPQGKVDEVLTLTTTGRPAGATHWSCRKMAAQVGLSPSTVHGIWRAAGLKPHQVRGFKLSRDPHFESKLRDVVGLYLDPPECAIVLSVDEKSQIQALDRTQPGLPIKRGKPATLHTTTSGMAPRPCSLPWMSPPVR